MAKFVPWNEETNENIILAWKKLTNEDKEAKKAWQASKTNNVMQHVGNYFPKMSKNAKPRHQPAVRTAMVKFLTKFQPEGSSQCALPPPSPTHST